MRAKRVLSIAATPSPFAGLIYGTSVSRTSRGIRPRPGTIYILLFLTARGRLLKSRRLPHENAIRSAACEVSAK